MSPSHASSSPALQPAVQVTPVDGLQADVAGLDIESPSGLTRAVDTPPIPADLTVEGRYSEPIPEGGGRNSGYSGAERAATRSISKIIVLLFGVRTGVLRSDVPRGR